MAERQENPMFGRKVFFVTPPIRFEGYVIEGLREQEYEVYVIHDYKLAKSVLKANKDALCFIYIDVGLKYDEWYKFIKTFEQDDILKTVFVGIISNDIPANKKEFFMLNTKLPGGFIMGNDGSLESLLKQVKNILDLNGAKGVRQYIRMDCGDDKSVNAYLTAGSRLFSLDVDNISSAGIAVSGSPDLINVLKDRSVVDNISLTVGRKTFVIKAVVLKSAVANGKCSSVILLPGLNNIEKNIIRTYIFERLDERFSQTLETSLVDNTNYAELQLEDEDGSNPLGDTYLFADNIKETPNSNNPLFDDSLFPLNEAASLLEPAD